jgi:hypothetical protein
MDDIAEGSILPNGVLAPAAKKLYDCISGKNFIEMLLIFQSFHKRLSTAYGILDFGVMNDSSKRPMSLARTSRIQTRLICG